jgi:diguanylate cyclase (GGDEF)-like protein
MKFSDELKDNDKFEGLESGLDTSLSLLKATLESTADGILVVDINFKMVAYNQKFRKMWKIPLSIMTDGNDDQAVEYVLKYLVNPKDFLDKLDFMYENPEEEVFGEFALTDGRILERYSIPQYSGKKIVGRVFSFRDITKRKHLEEQLVRQATYDVLTQLPNRILLEDRISQSIRQAKRTGKIIAILFFDLDRFKFVNDSLGHNIGDALLQAVARRLEHCIRETDTLARWGGDEFVIVASNLDMKEDIIHVIERCQQALAEIFKIGDHEIGITSSVGVSFYPSDGECLNSLLKNADSAMYHAKQEGANFYSFYLPHMNERAVEMLELERDLRYALENNEFILNYQPLLNISTGKIVGAEALIRWMHPKKGLIPPLDFIQLAEETGLILDIGEWVLRTACAQNKTWQNAGLPKICMAVNLSSQQFRHKEIVQTVAKILKDTKLKPQYLELELTESSIMGNTELYLRAMADLKGLGIDLAIDDFGTGYSSLSYLKKFPVSKLKIDKSFIRDLTTDSNDGAIVMAIIAMAQKLKLTVLAEGAETPEQLAFLKEQQCDYAQGYYFSKPVAASECEKLLTASHLPLPPSSSKIIKLKLKGR